MVRAKQIYIPFAMMLLAGGPVWSAGQCLVHPEILAAEAKRIDIEVFSDVLAAPLGAPITIFGEELGGPIRVGGVPMAECPVVGELVYDVPAGSKRLFKTTCWLNEVPLGDTSLTIGDSGPIDFRVIEGTVQTITDFETFKNAMKDPIPGDFYLLKGFDAELSIDGRANGGKHILWMRPGEHNATPLEPIALIGYPGDPATLIVDGVANGDRGISLQNDGWTVSNLNFETFWNSVSAEGEARIIGNRIIAMTGPKRGAGTGSVTAGGERAGGYIMGNTVAGGNSNWRFDHAIYVNGCPSEKGWTVAWNHIFDNDFARGPQVVVNHQYPRCGIDSENKAVASHTIANNIVDTTRYSGRCIGVSAFGWQPDFNPNTPATTYIENNFLINCGYVGDEVDQFGDARQGASIYVAEGGAEISGNILYRSNAGIQVGSTAVQTNPNKFLPARLKNNAFVLHQNYELQILVHHSVQNLVSLEGD